MRGRIVWLLLVAASMVPLSCTHKPYHPEKSDREWTIDHEDCEKSVRDEIRDEPYAYDNFDEMRMINQCMQKKGWVWKRTDWWKFKKDEPE